MASGEGQSNPSTSGDAGGDHNEDYGNEYGLPLPTQEELREMEHLRLVGEATNMMLNFAKDPKLAKYMKETAFQDVHAQWKATTISPPKPDSKKQYSEKELEQEVEARLAQILGAQDKGKKHDKKRKKSTDFPGYLGSVIEGDYNAFKREGRVVVIEQSFGAPKVTKDGATVAKSIEFGDKMKNLGASLVKQVANATNDAAGDGTTCATVLARSIFTEGCKAVAAGMNAMDLRKGIDMAVDSVVLSLKGRARMISTSEEIAQVRPKNCIMF
ncbi:hypothetical protein L7F22_008842 [Adiantum nelumboides]|nr:hypothetical protein [Adiantum nelumboides]